MKVFGFCGTFGAGKGTAIEIFTHILSEKGTVYSFSTSDLFRAELRKKGLSTDRETLRTFANEMRKTHGAGYAGKLAVKAINEREPDYALVDALRNPAEVDALKKFYGSDFTLIAIDAPIKLRYERTKTRNRGKEDQLTFEEFRASEELELKTLDPNGQRIYDVMKMANEKIENSASEKELEQKLKELIQVKNK